MYRRFHDRFGTAGVIIAVIALIAALGGTALAAGGLTSKQKKEVTKIAKKYAGKPGPAGTNGTNGANGEKGAPGEKGAKGDAGSAGTNGKSVVTTPIAAGEPGCNSLGGTEVEVEDSGQVEEVCNGEPGAQGAPGVIQPGETLPAGVTLSGTWSAANGTPESQIWAPISFNIPLETAPVAHYVTEAQQTGHTVPTGCNVGGVEGSAAAPLAASGNLCVFEATKLNMSSVMPAVKDAAGGFGASPFGAIVAAQTATTFGPPFEHAAVIFGSWAVTG